MPGLSSERSAAAGGIILVLRFAAGSVLNYAFGVALAWLLVPKAFGSVSALQNVLLLAAGTLTAGLPWALALRIASGDDDPATAQAHFRTAITGNVALSALFALGFLLAEGAGVRLVPQASPALIVTVACEIVILGYTSVLGGALQGSRRFGGLGAMQSFEILAKCVVALMLTVTFHWGAEGVALGFVAGSLVASVVARRALTGLLPNWGSLARLRSMSGAASIWIGTFCFTILLTADLLGLAVLGHGEAAALVATYQVCAILARAPYFVADAVMDAVFPFMAAERSSPAASHAWFNKALRAVPLVIVPGQLALLIAPGPILTLCFPHAYGSSESVLRLLDVGTIGLLLTNNSVKGLYAIHRPRAAALRMPWVVLLESVCLVVLVPRFGATGAAAAYCVASLSGACLLYGSYLRLQGAWPTTWATAGRYLASLGPCALIMLVSHWTDEISSLLLLAAAMSVYAILSFRTGLVTEDDLNAIFGRFTPIRGRHSASAIAARAQAQS